MADLEKLADEMERAEETPVLSSVLRFLARPGYAVKAAVSGDLGAAGRNMAQMAMDLPTGGFLSRSLSLGNLASDSGDITSRKDRYTAADMFKARGVYNPGGLEQFAAEVALDPLTYATFGGAGVGRGVLAGLSRETAAARFANAAMRTPAGQSILRGVPASQRAAVIERSLGLGSGGLGNLSREAEESVLSQAIKSGLIRDNTELRFMGVPVVSNVWGKVGNMTAPGIARKIGQKFAPDATAKIEGHVLDAWDWSKKNLLDNTLTSRFQDPRLKRYANEGAIVQGSKRWEWEQVGRNLVAKIPDEATRKLLTTRLYAASQDFRRQAYGLGKAQREAVARELQAGVEEGLAPDVIEGLRAYQAAASKARGELREAKVWANGKSVYDDEAAASLIADRDAAASRAAAAGPDTREAARAEWADAESAVAGFERALAKLRKSRPSDAASAKQLLGREADALLKRGIHFELDDPFYVPRQLNDAAAKAMPKGAALHARPGVKSVLLRKREYDTVEEWAAHIRGKAEAEGVPAAEAEALAGEAASAASLDDVAELDLAKLALRYGDKHGTTLGRAHLKNAAEAMGILKAPETAQYIDQVWGSMKARPAVQQWLASFNSKFKPYATVIWPSYHFRNLVSAIFQTALDKDLGLLDGLRAAASMVRDIPAINMAKKMGENPSDFVALMRAAGGDQDAIRHLAGVTIHGLPGDEVLRNVVGGVLSRSGGDADMFESVSTAIRLGQPTPKAASMPGRAFDKTLGAWRDASYSVASYTENSMRTHAFLNLLGKGVDPTDAVARVNRAFVDYKTQSTADRMLRDFFPFIRFSAAVTPAVVESAARAPGGAAMQLVREAGRTGDERDAEGRLGVPGYVRHGLGIPWGEQTIPLTGFSPHEAAAGLFGAVPLPGRQESSRQFLGGLAPMVRLPLEASSGVNFYTGGAFGGNRQAPAFAGYVPGLTKTYTTKAGDQYQEVPAWVNELVRVLPTARFNSVLNQVADDQKSTLDKVARFVLGVDRVTPDQRKGTARALAKYMARQAVAGKVGEQKLHWARLSDGEGIPEGLAEAIKAEQEQRRKK